MGLLSGTLSYIRFHVEGEVSNSFIERFEKMINLRKFIPLHPEGDDVKSHGWAIANQPFVEEENFHNGHFLYGDKIWLAYREDSIQLPKQIIKDKMAQRIREHQERTGDEPGAQLRKQIQLAVSTEIRRRVFPKSKIVEFLWDLSRKELRFLGRGKGITDRFIEHFEQTFELRLVMKDYPHLAALANLLPRDKALLEHLKPTEIFRPVVRTEIN